MPYNANEKEQEVLKFWDKDETFKKSVEERSEDQPYVFYDGPPFATGLPHYGHIVGSVMKDAVPRYWTMQGKRVERVWGWDCHGLPIENIVEKELGTKSKKDIEDIGVGKFNELCRTKVLEYVSGWEKVIYRLGRWVDMKNAYSTMDKNFMESVWWVFRELYDKGYIYKGYRSMHICPRCETTLSQQEVSEGYKDVKDITVIVKFKVRDEFHGYKNFYILAWTTTPWTLPGNVLLAVGEDIDYTVFNHAGSTYVVAKELLDSVMGEKTEFEVLEQIKGSDLVGQKYEPLFNYYADTVNAFQVVSADFVTTSDGTGVVHIAPGFGEDDYQIGLKHSVGWVQHIGIDGVMRPEVTDFAGLRVKSVGDTMSTDIEIIRYLAGRDLLFKKQKIEHSYPHCWRCDTPLLNYATDSWFVKVSDIKPRALETAMNINWSPAHIKEGRFGKWLEGARDWSISRQRFWASCMPIWICEKSDTHMVVFGSVSELEERCGRVVDDLHKHTLDEITFTCTECDGLMKRVPDVLDTWFDSGSMPYGQVHYPFENKEKFEGGFPAEFIAEGQDQTRAWFYYLHIIATAIKDKPAFNNVIVNGIVLAEDGKKMSKKLQNYPDPMMTLETYGADALRYYILVSPVMQAEDLLFSPDGVREVYNKVVNTLANVLSFYEMFATEVKVLDVKSEQVLDRWIMAKLNKLITESTEAMNVYHLPNAVRPIMEFIADLSQWYVRRSRDRFKGDDENDKILAFNTLREVLLNLSRVMAPFTPFIAETVWQSVSGKNSSVHLEMWPIAGGVDEEVLIKMTEVRKVVELGLSLRKEAGIKVRQPLNAISVNREFTPDYISVMMLELNVNKVTQDKEDGWLDKKEGELVLALDTSITTELKKVGLLREIVRAINQLRKEASLVRGELADVLYTTEVVELKEIFVNNMEDIKKMTHTDNFLEGGENELDIDGYGLKLSILKK